MPLEIELFAAPGCGQCASATRKLRAMVHRFGDERVTWRKVDILEELDHAVALGVLSTPSIAINGELVFSAVPRFAALRAALEARLAQTPNAADSSATDDEAAK